MLRLFSLSSFTPSLRADRRAQSRLLAIYSRFWVSVETQRSHSGLGDIAEVECLKPTDQSLSADYKRDCIDSLNTTL